MAAGVEQFEMMPAVGRFAAFIAALADLGARRAVRSQQRICARDRRTRDRKFELLRIVVESS